MNTAPASTSISQTTTSTCTSTDEVTSTAVCQYENGVGDDIIFSCDKCPTTPADLEQCQWLCAVPTGNPDESVLQCADGDYTDSSLGITCQQCLPACSPSPSNQTSSSARTASSTPASTALTTASIRLYQRQNAHWLDRQTPRRSSAMERPIDASDLERCPWLCSIAFVGGPIIECSETNITEQSNLARLKEATYQKYEPLCNSNLASSTVSPTESSGFNPSTTSQISGLMAAPSILLPQSLGACLLLQPVPPVHS